MSPMQAWMPGEGPLTDAEVTQLARYNGERGHGVVHTADYQVKMALLQQRFDDQALERAKIHLERPSLGVTRISGGTFSWAWFWFLIAMMLAWIIIVAVLR